MERFAYHGNCGSHISASHIAGLSTEELAEEIRTSQEWDADLLYDLCWRADMEDEFDAADDIGFEAVAYAAAEKLGVDIG